jgi:hypothetical protein
MQPQVAVAGIKDVITIDVKMHPDNGDIHDKYWSREKMEIFSRPRWFLILLGDARCAALTGRTFSSFRLGVATCRQVQPDIH